MATGYGSAVNIAYKVQKIDPTASRARDMSDAHRTKGNASGLGISTRTKEIVADARVLTGEWHGGDRRTLPS
ncbi:MAG: hypothetical protein F4221_03490 [Rhodothermaceae bacterium]|nr:hypothetical protein [Rhodothermaceae bacterium]